jgi:hypothetical protein
VSILDPDAAVQTVNALNAAQARLSTVDVGRLAEALLMPRPADESRPHPIADLVAGGIAAVAALLVR